MSMHITILDMKTEIEINDAYVNWVAKSKIPLTRMMAWNECAKWLLSQKEIICPFCGDDDFDKIGLKHHLNTYCKVYPDVKDI